MIKKLIRHGNSTALILDKPLLKILNIAHDTPLKIQTDGRSIIVTPVHEDEKVIKSISDNDAVQKAFEEIMRTYAPALKKLSEN
jgi:antitoxin component of MazEF toxin-antitoxin module